VKEASNVTKKYLLTVNAALLILMFASYKATSLNQSWLSLGHPVSKNVKICVIQTELTILQAYNLTVFL